MALFIAIKKNYYNRLSNDKEMKGIETQTIQIQRQNKFLETLNNLLHDIDALQPTEIGLFILNNNRLNVQNHVVHLICTWFQRYNGQQGAKLHQDRLKFIHCFDKLIRQKVYCDLINACLVKIFCDAFYSYNQELNFQKLQDLKILFHIWSPFITHSNSQLIKSRIEKMTKIDIYKHLKNTSKKFIQTYFAKQRQESFLQKKKQQRCLKDNNRNAFVNEKPSEPRSQATTAGRNSISKQDEFWDLDKSDQRKMFYVQNEVLLKKRKVFIEAFPFQKNIIENEFLESEKILSHEGTEISERKAEQVVFQGKKQEIIPDIEKKQVQLPKQSQQERLKNIKQILSKLKKINQFQCNRCGKSMITKQHFDIHMEAHFQQNMKSYNESLIQKPKYSPYSLPVITNKKILKPKQKIMSISEWINKPKEKQKLVSISTSNLNKSQQFFKSNENDFEIKHSVSVIVKDYDHQSTNDYSDQNQENFCECECKQIKNIQIKSLQYKSCYFCGQTLRISIQNSEFIFEDTIKVKGIDKNRLMHKQCYDILMNSSQSQSEKKPDIKTSNKASNFEQSQTWK